MTEIVIASRDVTLWDPDTREGFRLVRGRTLADARHACVRAYPDNWSPITVDLSVEDDTVSRETAQQADEAASQMAGELYDARTEADGYRATLASIVELLNDRNLIAPTGIDADHEGWLVEVLREVLPASGGSAAALPAEPEQVEDDPIPAPARPARKTRAKASPSVSDDAAN